MGIVEAIVLGAIQGLGEFLPISSSGHLALAQDLFGLEVPLLFDVILHLATLLAVLLVLRKQVAALAGAWLRFCVRKSRPGDEPALAMFFPLLIATAITAGVGFLVERYAGQIPAKAIGACFIVTALGLLAASRVRPRKPEGEVGPLDGALIGLAQGIGVLPGISRSGATISSALARGVGRRTAGEFSFLLSIPAVLGAFILSLRDADTLMVSVDPLPLALAFAAAFAVGLAALLLLLRLLRGGKLGWFACYLVPAGLAAIIFL